MPSSYTLLIPLNGSFGHSEAEMQFLLLISKVIIQNVDRLRGLEDA